MVRSQAQIVLQPADVGSRHKARAQQAMHVQRRTPLRIVHVGLAARSVARLAAVDHAHVQTRRFEHAVHRQPVHPGGFHRHRVHALGQQPVAQCVQLRGHRAEYHRHIATH